MDEVFADTKLKETTAESVSSVVSVLRLQPKDVLVCNIEVGKMPPPRVTELLSQQKDLIKSVMPEGVKVLIVAMRDGVPGVEITVLRSEE